VAQFARPNADLSLGGFTNNGGGPLYTAIDEVVPDDADYDVSTAWIGGGFDTLQVALPALADPHISTGHVIRFRYSVPVWSGGSYGAQIELLQGGLTITSPFEARTTTVSPTTFEYTLTAAEADSITDYSDLSLVVLFFDSGFSSAAEGRVHWLEFEVPDLGPTITTQPIDVNVIVPNNVAFSVEAAASAGGGALSYQWQKQEAGLGAWSNVGGATSSTYTFASAGTDMRDRYRCNVTDANGTVTSNSALVTVRAYDILLYAKAEADGVASNVWLRDPTQSSAAPAITGTAASGQGAQTVDAAALLQFIAAAVSAQGSQSTSGSALLQFIAAGVSGQGSQSASATALLQFVASAVSAQGGQSVAAAASLDFTATVASAQGAQTVDAAELEQFIAAVASGQGSQSAAVAAQLVFIAVAESAQGSETVDASGFNGVLFFGDVTTAQGGQTADAAGEVAAPRDQSSGGRISRTLGVRLDRRNLDLPGEQRVYGEAASAQGSQTADGAGEVRAPQQVDGRAESAQVLAEVIAIGAVDNRRPRNQQKKKYAAALLAA
jgi:hypothetical protein